MVTGPAVHNITALTLYVDTNIVDARDDAALSLRRLRDEGWINLQRTDTMGTELAAAREQKRAQLTEASASYPEAFGPMVWGQSRWDSSVFGSSEDQARLDTVFAILFPGAERTSTRGNNVRDAMHISTAIRYGAFGFVTRDRKLLNKFQQIADRFQGFRVWPPEDAVAEAIDRIRAARELHRREPHRGALPAWPSDDDLPSPSLG